MRGDVAECSDSHLKSSICNGSLDALRPGFLSLAFRHDGGAEAISEVFREFVELGVSVDLNRLFSCVANDVAVMAPSEMIFEFRFRALVHHAVQIVGQLLQKFRAFHLLPSPLSRFWK